MDGRRTASDAIKTGPEAGGDRRVVACCHSCLVQLSLPEMVNSPLTNADRLGRQSWNGLPMCPGRVARALAWPSQKHNIAFYRTWTLPLLKDTPCPIGEQKMRLVVSAPWTTRTGVGAGRFGCLGATSSRRPSMALVVGRVPSFEWAAYLRRIRSPSVRSPVLLPNGMERFIVAACHSNFFCGRLLSALGFALGAPFAAAAIIYPLCPSFPLARSRQQRAMPRVGRLGP